MSRHVCEIGGSSCQKPVCIWNEGPLGIFLMLKEEVAWQQAFDPWRGPYSIEEQGSLSTVWCLSSGSISRLDGRNICLCPSQSWGVWMYKVEENVFFFFFNNIGIKGSSSGSI